MGKRATPSFASSPSIANEATASSSFIFKAARFRRRLPEVLVNQFLEAAEGPDSAVVVERQHLHHLHAADVFDRVDPELGVEDAGPAHAARAAELGILRIVRRDLKTEAEFIVSGAERERFGA